MSSAGGDKSKASGGAVEAPLHGLASTGPPNSTAEHTTLSTSTTRVKSPPPTPSSVRAVMQPPAAAAGSGADDDAAAAQRDQPENGSHSPPRDAGAGGKIAVAKLKDAKLHPPGSAKANDVGADAGGDGSGAASIARQPSKQAPRYKRPSWSAKPETQMRVEVMKAGQVVDSYPIKRESFLIGRSPESDLIMEHPSVSRHHAVIQFRDGGLSYIYDAGSTHGTQLNKQPIKPRVYCRLRVGDMIRFGQSSRLVVLTGTREAQEEVEMEKDQLYEEKVQEIRQARREKALSLQVHRREVAMRRALHGDGSQPHHHQHTSGGRRDDADEDDGGGAMWGMSFDGEDDAAARKKRADGGGDEMDEDPDDVSGMYDDDEGDFLSGSSRPKKKHRGLGLEGPSTTSTAAKKKDDDDEEMSGLMHGTGRLDDEGAGDLFDVDDEDDEFYDRTKATRKKKQSAETQAGGVDANVESLQSLRNKKAETLVGMVKLRQTIQPLQQELDRNTTTTTTATPSDDDDLDAYMQTVSTEMKAQKLTRLQEELVVLEQQNERLDRLIQLAQPALPGLQQATSPVAGSKKALTSPTRTKATTSTTKSPAAAAPTSAMLHAPPSNTSSLSQALQPQASASAVDKEAQLLAEGKGPDGKKLTKGQLERAKQRALEKEKRAGIDTGDSESNVARPGFGADSLELDTQATQALQRRREELEARQLRRVLGEKDQKAGRDMLTETLPAMDAQHGYHAGVNIMKKGKPVSAEEGHATNEPSAAQRKAMALTQQLFAQREHSHESGVSDAVDAHPAGLAPGVVRALVADVVSAPRPEIASTPAAGAGESGSVPSGSPPPSKKSPAKPLSVAEAMKRRAKLQALKARAASKNVYQPLNEWET